MVAVNATRNAAMKDPAFIQELKKRKLPFNPTGGQKLQAFIGSVVATPEPVLAELRTAFSGK